jgi:hypothetical protein
MFEYTFPLDGNMKQLIIFVSARSWSDVVPCGVDCLRSGLDNVIKPDLNLQITIAGDGGH